MNNCFGTNHAFRKPVQSMSRDEIKYSIDILKTILNSGKYKYSVKDLKSRIFELEEFLDYFNNSKGLHNGKRNN